MRYMRGCQIPGKGLGAVTRMAHIIRNWGNASWEMSGWGLEMAGEP